MMQRVPLLQRSTPSQSKPITSFLSDEGSTNSRGSWDAWLTTWIGIDKILSLKILVPEAYKCKIYKY